MCEEASLRERLRNLLESKFEDLNSNEEGEFYATICQNEWIRMLLVRSQINPSAFTIDIEMTLPIWSFSESDLKKQKEIHDLLIGTKSYIDYLIHLQEVGFILEMIGREFLCTATLEFACDHDIDSIVNSVAIPRPDCK